MLSRILSESLLVAKDFHHEFFTPEHVLATAIRDEFVEQLLANSGGDTKELKSEVSNYLTTQLPVISENANPEIIKSPVESAGFQAMDRPPSVRGRKLLMPGNAVSRPLWEM